LADLKAKVPTIRSSIDNKAAFKQYYEFFFDYSKEPAAKFMGMQPRRHPSNSDTMLLAKRFVDMLLAIVSQECKKQP
jgi:hypothetical protein